jgi:hypothetical protein
LTLRRDYRDLAVRFVGKGAVKINELVGPGAGRGCGAMQRALGVTAEQLNEIIEMTRRPATRRSRVEG